MLLTRCHLAKGKGLNNGHFIGRMASTASRALLFQDLYKDLKERLERSCLNTTQRNLVYRPSKTAALTSRVEPIMVKGEALVPKVWRGPPGKKDLVRCIRQIATDDDFLKAKDIIRLYHAHYPEKLNSRHATRFLRQGTIIGQFNESLTFARSTNFSTKLDHEFHKELVRLHAIRLQFFNKGDERLPLFLSLFDSATGLEYTLLKFVGLSNMMSGIGNQSTDALRDALKESLNEVYAVIERINLESELSLPKPKVRSFLITVALAVQHLELRQQDALKLKALIEASGEPNVENFTNSYVEQVQKGFERELLRAR